MTQLFNPWCEVLRRLLKHFDDSKGTTYLYDDEERKRFIADTDPAIRDEVGSVLNQYHS